MHRIMRRFQCLLVSAVESIVMARPHGHLECFTRDILQTTTARAIEARPAQRLAIAAAMADAQPTILPESTFRAEALRRVNVGTETAGPNRTDTRNSAKQLDL